MVYQVTLRKDQKDESPPEVRYVLATNEPGNGPKDWDRVKSMTPNSRQKLLAKISQQKPIDLVLNECPQNNVFRIPPFEIISATLPDDSVITPESIQADPVEPAAS